MHPANVPNGRAIKSQLGILYADKMKNSKRPAPFLIIKNAVHSNINFLPLMYIFPILILITCIFIINNNKKYDIFSQLTNKVIK